MLKPPTFTRTLPALVGLLILSACGGGGGDAGSTTPTDSARASAQASTGTVTGFGSVIVDGTEIDDSSATVCTEDISGTDCTASTKLQLGQRVNVRHHASGAASTITVAAGVIGLVSDKTSTSLTVAGQRVTVNTDATAGPLTAFGGTTAAGVAVTSLDDIANNDTVAVHGTPVYNTALGAYEVAATRIEAKSAINHVRLLGKVTGLTSSNFTLNGVTIDIKNTTVAPTGTALAEGQSVIVFVRAANGVVTPTTQGWPAQRILVLHRDVGAQGSLAAFGGTVSQCGATTGTASTCTTFEVGGLTVDASSAKITPTGATVQAGAYVRLAGTMNTNGSVLATHVHVRQANTDDDLARVRLLGTIDSVDTTDSKLIVVRGVPVDTTGATLKSCPSTGWVAGGFVDVKAQAQAGTDVVLASTVRCGTLAEAIVHRNQGHDGSADAYQSTTPRSAAKGWGKYLKRQR